MSYHHRLLLRSTIVILVGLFLCISLTVLLGVTTVLEIVIPLIVLIGIGALAFWIDQKYWGHTTRFIRLRTAVAMGVAFTSAVLSALILDPRAKNFAWYYPFIVALISGVVAAVVTVVAPLNFKVREYIWGKKPIRLYGRITKPEDAPK